MRTLASSLLTAILLPLLTLPAGAQVFSWAQGQPFSFQRNPALVKTVAAPSLDYQGVWWSAPEQHRYHYGQDELSSVRVQRVDAAGTVRAQRLVEGNLVLHHAVLAPDGGVYLVGGFRDSLVFDAQHRLAPAGVNLTYFLARLDSAAQVDWVRPLRTPSVIRAQDVGGLAVDPLTHDVWVAYDIYSDSYLTRFTATGDSVTSFLQHDVNRITSVAVAPDGTVYTAGSCAGPAATYNGLSAPTSLSYSDYVACYEPSGHCRWVRYVESITCGSTYVSTADTSGVYMAGNLYGVVQFGSFTAGQQGALFGNYYVTRLTRTRGDFQWVQSAPVAQGTVELAPSGALATDQAGRAWLLITHNARYSWPGGYALTPPTGGALGLICYDQQGQLAAAIGNTGQNAQARSLMISPFSHHGTLTGLAPRGGAQLGPVSLPATGQGDLLPFVASFDIIYLLGQPENPALPGFSLSPNPALPGSTIALTGLLESGAPPREVIVFDAMGRLVSRQLPSASTPALVAPSQPGLYAVRVRHASGRTLTTRLIVD